jgi:hypothetical protein
LFSSQPEAYQDQIATLSREERLTRRHQGAKKTLGIALGISICVGYRFVWDIQTIDRVDFARSKHAPRGGVGIPTGVLRVSKGKPDGTEVGRGWKSSYTGGAVVRKLAGLVAFYLLGIVFYLTDGSDRYADRKNIKQRRRECW